MLGSPQSHLLEIEHFSNEVHYGIKPEVLSEVQGTHEGRIHIRHGALPKVNGEYGIEDAEPSRLMQEFIE